ncbi:flagellar protein FlgN [Clostridium neuense]|uniref:Flagellar protein FlgN n=1 Tax=Clostridium neuense TaxID=1728934 RepID=A0ABW8THP8_9CLOT
MKEALSELILREIETLKNLLMLLEKQHELYLEKNIFGLEDIVKKIENANIEVAKIEVERRKLEGDKSIKILVKEIDDDSLSKNFDDMIQLVHNVKSQNSINQFLIKQGLLFANKMLNLFGRNKNVKTYNAYGKVSK